jgi:Domain of unknown function (DUF4388)
MNAPAANLLGGHLRLVAGGVQFGLPLDRVLRVALAGDERRLPARNGAEAWWRGVALEGGRSVPIVSLSGLLGLRSTSAMGGADVLVHCRVGAGRVILECEAVRGIVPATVVADALPPGWLATGGECFPRVLRTPEVPVLELAPEALFPIRRRQLLTKLMSESEPSIEKLWALSELENKLSLAPTSVGYRKLALGYANEGWSEDATRIAQRADELEAREKEANPFLAAPEGSTTTPTTRTAPVFSGSFNPRVLLELLQVLHLTGKSGELRLAAPGGATACFAFNEGRVVGAESTDAAPGEESLVRAVGLEGGRYEFVLVDTNATRPGPLADTAGSIQRMAEALA